MPCDRGGDPRDVGRRRAAAAADDVDQAGLGELARAARRSRPGSGRSRRTRSAGRRSGGRRRTCRRAGPARPRAGASRPRPASSSTPTTSGWACSIELQNASTVWPGQRPAAQVDDRHRDPQRQVRRDLAGGGDGGLRVERVEDGLDQQQVDAALGQRLRSARRRRPGPASNVTARYAGSSTRGDSDRVTFSGPIEPATNRPPNSSAACRASWAPAQVHLPHQRLAGRSRPGRCWSR